MALQLVAKRAMPPYDTMRFRVLDGFWGKLRGLLGTDTTAGSVALVGCNAIHTFAMGYRIDVAFVTSDGHVVASHCSVPPGRLVSHKEASIVLERPHARGRWLAAGEAISMTWMDCDAPVLARGAPDGEWQQRRAS